MVSELYALKWIRTVQQRQR